ncbi:MAG: hypothetical protein JWO94_4011 [Verrucomicrobiaceae bacterium]|nr:hypothetical protein [Verrucomicrobiaceae bacterium]
MQNLPPLTPLIVLMLMALLPVAGTCLVALVPSRRREVSGITLGNPLECAPLAPVLPALAKPLVHLTRSLSGGDIGGYILGLRHLPVELGAPLLARFVNGNDPALQLYAQGILQQGRDDLSVQFHRLQKQPVAEPRAAAWLLETGLRLANPSLCSPTERPGFLKHLVSLAAERLQGAAEPSPALLANAARVFLEAGLLEEAHATAALLPHASPLSVPLAAAIAHARHQKALA